MKMSKITQMNKKAQFDLAMKTIYWMIAAFVITLIIIGFSFIIADYRNKLTQVPSELKADLIDFRFASSSECFAYNDSNKVYPGIINLNKFNEETLFKCYHTEEKKGYKIYNFGLKLKDKDLFLRTNNYYHQTDFTVYENVLVRENGELIPDTLIIYVQEKI